MLNDEYLLIDGYNIIFSWENLKKIAMTSLEDARDKLIEIISNYQGYNGMNTIIVFDAHLVKGNTGSTIDCGNITVIYTREAQTADNYIERTTRILNKQHRVKVATSDRIEQIIITGKGAMRISAKELEEDIKTANKNIETKITQIKPVKNNMLINNLDSKTAELLEKMRRQ